jgi:predicted phage tail protein
MVPVPVPYGNFRTAGNIIGVHTEPDGNDQILFMLINAGEGPIASISDIEINGRKADEFDEVSFQTRLGEPLQTPIDWFSTVITPYQKNQQIPNDGSYLTFATQDGIEGVRLDINFPSGLYSVNTKTGSIEANQVAIEADYRVAGSGGAWLPFSTQAATYQTVRVQPVTAIGIGNLPNENLWDAITHGGAVIPWDPTQTITDLHITTDVDFVLDSTRQAIFAKFGSYVGKNIQEWPAFEAGTVSTSVAIPPQPGALVIKDSDRSAVRRVYGSPQLPAGKYEVRVRRDPNYIDYDANKKGLGTTINGDTASSDCYVSDLNEIVYEGIGYNHTALLAVRVKLDAQLSGVPSVTFMNGGRIIQTFTRANGVITMQQQASNNAAWVQWDALTHWRYGAGIDTSRLDLSSWIDWAEYCAANGLSFDGVFDSTMNAWDAANYISRAGHAQMVPVGTRYSLIIERPSDPVMLFGMGNIIEGSFTQSWMSRTDRATEVDVTFFDKTDGYKQKTVKVADSTAALEGRKQNTSAITAYGVVDIQRAYLEGALQMNLNRYLTQTCEWDSPIEALACAPGDVVLVQHDQPAWGFSGRTAAGSTASSIRLDKLVTMEAGKAYKLLVLSNSATRLTSTAGSVTGNFIAVPGVPTTLRIRRIRNAAGVETAVTSVVPDGVYVDSTAGFAAGQAVTLIDTDVIEDHDVVLQPGDTDTITPTTALSFVPDAFTVYMFGETTKVRKPFRITSITLASNDMQRHLQALEYRAEVYDLSNYKDIANTLTPPLLDPQQAAIGVVQSLSVYEETYVAGSLILTDVRASWAQPIIGNYAGADVYLQINGGAFNKVGTVRADTSFVVPGVKKGDALTVLVQSFDIWGKYSPYGQAPMVNYSVVGTITNVSSAAVSGADFIWAGRDCKIFWNYNSTTASFEFGSEPEGAAGARDPHFLDYEIRVYDLQHKLLRTEHTTDNSYVYTFEKNFVDGLHRHVTFEIAVRDIFSNVGKPAVLDAYNPPPTVLTAATNAAYDRIQLNFTHSEDTDYAGAQVLLRWSGDVGPTPTLVYDGPDTAVLMSNLMFNSDYYITIVPYDAFGLDETIPSNEIHVHTPFLDVEAIAEGVLKDSQLIPALQTRIDLVDAPDSIIGSVNQRLAAAKATLTDAISAAVTSESTTRANADGALGTRVDLVVASTGANTAAIQSETTARTTADSALSTRLDLVAASTGSNTAAIQTEATARTSADSAMADQINTIAASFGYDTTNLCANPIASGGLTTGWSAVTAVSGTAPDVPIGAPAAYLFRQNIRDALYTTRTVPVSGGQQHYLEMRAATPVSPVPLNLGLRCSAPGKTDVYLWASTLNATATWTRMSGMVTIPDGYTTAQLTVVVDFGAGVNNDKNRWYYTDVEWRPASLTQPAMAAISTESTARANADGALSTRIDSVNASLGTTNANVQTEITARAAGDAANASSITQLTTTVNGHTATIQTAQSSINGLNAQYTVKIDNNGYVSGYGLASTTVNGTPKSEFAVRADTFSIQLPGYAGVHPFTVGAVYGVPRVIISSALIGDASIDNAKIGDAQINSAKIAYAAINTAHIGTAQIDTLRIGPNAVSTMAAFGMGFNGGAAGYQSGGGVMLVMLFATCGSYQSQALGGAPLSGTVTASIAGQSVSVTGTGGPNYGSNSMLIQPGAGSFTLNVSTSGTISGPITAIIFEAKR